jgi:p-hydroxybenzoate 3-monooxygenase
MTDTTSTRTERTRVAIVGAGPAGLILSHLLAEAGIDSVVVDSRSREQIESTIRAGILEQNTADLLRRIDPATRVDTVGHRHDGIELRFGGEGHRIDFPSLVGRSVWLYPQHEVLKDLLALRLGAGQDLQLGVTVEQVDDDGSGHPKVVARDADGSPLVIEADFVVGADGSRSVVRPVVTGSRTGGYFREYPFAWFGILCQAAPSSEELIYSNSQKGFALISQRSPDVQRMYYQCDPTAAPEAPSDAEIWEALQTRVPGTTLNEGPIIQRDVLLAEALRSLLVERDERLIDGYAERALARIWKAQHFSWWMTSMLHSSPDASDFDHRRQLGELRSVVESEAGRTYLAEAYTGWPLP